MHLMNFTRLDIAYDVSCLSRYTQNPNHDHQNSLVRLMKNLRCIINYGIMFSRFPIVLEEYSDANWIPDSDKTKSISGYVFMLRDSVNT